MLDDENKLITRRHIREALIHKTLLQLGLSCTHGCLPPSIQYLMALQVDPPCNSILDKNISKYEENT